MDRRHGMIPATGQNRCYDDTGREIPCAGSCQDGEYRLGAPWPEPRLIVQNETVLDRLTARLSGRGQALTRLEVQLRLDPQACAGWRGI